MSKKTDQTLKKCDDLISRLQDLKKALGDVTSVQSNRTPVNALGVGWSQDPGTGAFHHSTHGIISTFKNPETGGFNIVHGGRQVGQVGDMSQAGLKIKSYVNTLNSGDTGMQNINPMAVNKKDNLNKSATKTYTPAQQAAINEVRKLKKNAEAGSWAQHAALPNADIEVEKMNKVNPPEVAENLMSNQLANLMLGKAMLNQPPKQPTDQEMFGHMAVTEEMEKAAEAQWHGNAFNSFLQEAFKPISSRFSSEEEEAAYWASIKVDDRGGTEGY